MNSLTFTKQSNASLSSVINYQSISSDHSTPPLRASNPPKDYASTLAQLQSTYGIGGHVPAPLSAKQEANSIPLREKSASYVLSITSSSKSPPCEKGFPLAFFHLQSQYGLGGSAPQPLPSTPSTSPKLSTEVGLTSNSALAQKSTKPRDYETTFAQVLSKFGFPSGMHINQSGVKSESKSGECVFDETYFFQLVLKPHA
jgi:hypothetical protein